MAKVLTAHADEQRTSSLATWILISVSVAVIVAIAVSIPHLMGGAGWAGGDKFLYLALVGYLGAGFIFSRCTGITSLSPSRTGPTPPMNPFCSASTITKPILPGLGGTSRISFTSTVPTFPRWVTGAALEGPPAWSLV